MSLILRWDKDKRTDHQAPTQATGHQPPTQATGHQPQVVSPLSHQHQSDSHSIGSHRMGTGHWAT